MFLFFIFFQVAEFFAAEKLAVVVLRADFSSALKFFKIKASEIPTVVVVQWPNGLGQRPYQLFLHSQGEPDKLTAPGLQAFGQQFLKGQQPNWIEILGRCFLWDFSRSSNA